MAEQSGKQGVQEQCVQDGKGFSRRRFVAGAALASVAARGWLAQAVVASERNILLVGTQTNVGSKGIYSYQWNAATGVMAAQTLAATVLMPTFLALAPDGLHVYSVNELASGAGEVTGFHLDRTARTLTAINPVSSLGGGPCHVAVDRTGRDVFAANYGGGSAVSFRVATSGALSNAVEDLKYTVHGPNPKRQDAAHAHRVTVSPDNGWLLVNDLGGDLIHVYHLNSATARLTPANPPAWKATPGSGPRSLRFHPNGRWAYNVNELDQTAELLKWDTTAGTLTSLQRVQLGPAGPSATSTASESAIDSRGVFAYFAVRGADILVTCLIDRTTGKLTVLDRLPCGGHVPRHIALDPSEKWLLAANQGSGNIAVFQRDVTTGKLTATGKHFAISTPQCLLFA